MRCDFIEYSASEASEEEDEDDEDEEVEEVEDEEDEDEEPTNQPARIRIGQKRPRNRRFNGGRR